MKPHPMRRCLPGLLLLLSGLLLPPGVAAQTALLDVPGTGGTKLFQLNDDAGLVAKGSFGTGVIPATGVGVRLMWYPGKAAFRAGRATSTEWDDANIGDYSVAMGLNTRAMGDYATALGNQTTASGLYATAMNFSTTASGNAATAMGFSTTASGNISTAMGIGTEASGDWSTALGNTTTASGLSSTAIGGSTEASGNYATAMGIQTTAQPYASLVLGQYNVIDGTTDTWVATDPILVVGNGSDTSTRSNTLTLFKDGNMTIAGTLTELSDRRLKRDIHPLTNALASLARLQPVRFRFREGINRPQEQQIGLIAQEVAGVFPELVRQGADGYWSVSYANLSAVLVQALNEQQAEIDEQQAEIDALNVRLARLEAALLRPGSRPATATNR